MVSVYHKEELLKRHILCLSQGARMEYNKRQDQKGTGGIGVEDQFNTMKHNPIVGTGNEARDILSFVYQALQVKGYDPVDQMVGYLMTGDPTYITSYNSARSLIGRVDRDTLLEELVRSYLETL